MRKKRKKSITKKNEKIFRGKLSKLIVSYYVLIKKSPKLNVGPADTGHARQKWGESMWPPSPSMHRPFKKNSYKKNFEKKKSKKSSKLEIFTMVKIQNIFRPMFL